MLVPLSSTSHASASEEATLVTCLGTETATHDPGLKPQPQMIHARVETTYPTCSDGGTATSTVDGTLEASCLDLRIAQLPEVVNWSDGTSTHIQYDTVAISTTGLVTVVVADGEAVAGKYEGASVNRVVAIADNALLACLSPQGVTSMSGSSNLVLSG
ncbi:hypothetical protein ACIBKX_32780 [Streptomyces sp. NPDC050658]|uniref:hypothetical protein n=1 Tax=unclassified Streptomyces TaxID=2593676 RepID=UPI003445D7CD